MTAPVVGFYVHHDGHGHLDRTRAMVDALGAARCVVATSHPAASDLFDGTLLTALPSDVPPVGALGIHDDVTANGTLHWAPRAAETATKRALAICQWVQTTAPATVVVDVSVEVALQVRLLGVPVVAVRLPGKRNDRAHRLGFDLAEEILAPWSEALESPNTAAGVQRRTSYCGLVTRFDAPVAPRVSNGSSQRERRVLVVWGQGTAPPTARVLDEAAASTPGWAWSFAGPPPPDGLSQLVEHLGWRDDIATLAAEADVLVGTAGVGTLGLAAATRSRLVVLPQRRPFEEQQYSADALERLDIAVVEHWWPSARRWPSVLNAASRLDPARLDLLEAEGAAGRAAHLVDAVARRAQNR